VGKDSPLTVADAVDGRFVLMIIVKSLAVSSALSSPRLLSSLELSDTKVYEPHRRALHGTASQFCVESLAVSCADSALFRGHTHTRLAQCYWHTHTYIHTQTLSLSLSLSLSHTHTHVWLSIHVLSCAKTYF
jgi:hypothetical protein